MNFKQSILLSLIFSFSVSGPWCSAVASSSAIRLPTIDEARAYRVPAIQLDSYKLGKTELECSIPNGGVVPISPVSDLSQFRFLAVKSFRGPMIIANERVLRGVASPYSIFSFYRECGLLSVAKVETTGPDFSDDFDKEVIRAAECLAVHPTKKKLGEAYLSSLPQISRRLREEYNSRVTSSFSELQKCDSSDYVQSVLRGLRQQK